MDDTMWAFCASRYASLQSTLKVNEALTIIIILLIEYSQKDVEVLKSKK